MSASVPTLSMNFMCISIAISVLLPIALLLYFRFRKNANILPFFVGCGVMLLFAFVLEQIVHSIVLTSPAGTKIQGSIWLMALYGGLMAGLFEETGRFIAFKTVLRSRRNNDYNALMYGAGHGGFEAMMIFGVTMINNLTWSILINSGNTEMITGKLSGEALAQAEQAIQTLITMPSYQFLMGGLERLFAIIPYKSQVELLEEKQKKLNPLVSIFTFVCFEKTKKIAFRHTFPGIIPMLIYAVYYVAAAMTHIQNGMIAPGYDWYGFFFAGARSVVIVLPIVIALTYGISVLLWKWNRR